VKGAARTLAGRRVLITGAARGIGALTARRLHDRGARVALLGLEPDQLLEVAATCGDAPWFECDVADRDQVEATVAGAVARLGGLDVAVANAGIGAQMTLIDGDPQIWDATFAVNLMGTYNLVRAAGPHVAHPGGYFLLTASLAAAVHLPLMSAYCASKAAVESLGDSLRVELRPTGARVGVAYYAELDTDMTTRGFATKAAARTPLGGNGLLPVSPVEPAIDALERGIRRRSRRIVSPAWVAAVLPFRELAQRLVELEAGRGLAKTLEIARNEHAPLTTPQPQRSLTPDRPDPTG
jgi:NAD(P)-dependent dehydrogenase (short-subunit alcohol dehydrogenase family)